MVTASWWFGPQYFIVNASQKKIQVGIVPQRTGRKPPHHAALLPFVFCFVVFTLLVIVFRVLLEDDKAFEQRGDGQVLVGRQLGAVAMPE